MQKIKREIRIAGFDDSPFIPRSQGRVPVVGTVFRGGDFMDGMLKFDVGIDGMDATSAIIDVIKKSKHKKQLRVIMFDGITVGGFNLINISEVFKKTELPVIAINRKKPNLKKIKTALKNFKDFNERWKCIKDAGRINKVKIERNKNLYYQSKGLKRTEAEKIIRLSCTRGLIPEPLRIAHLIASALVKGESEGRA